MPFDPLAFLKPDKAFAMEGLLSRDMFEKFAEDDEADYHQLANGDNLDDVEDTDDVDVPYGPESEERLQIIADMIDDQPEQIAQWLNEGYLVVVAMTPDVYALVLLDDDQNQAVMCRVRINDGPPLSRDSLERLAGLIEEKVKSWFCDQVTTYSTFASDGSDQINMALISSRWVLSHANIEISFE